MANKFKVSQKDKVYGHYAARSFDEAVQKAIEHYKPYGGVIEDEPFEVECGNLKTKMSIIKENVNAL